MRQHKWGQCAFWLALGLFYLFNVLTYFDYTQDDPGISFRYGANLFSGQGLVYNPGERVEGYSNIGWVVLTGMLGKLLELVLLEPRAYVLFAAKLSNLFAGFATIILCYRYGRDILGFERFLARLAACLVAANGAFIINVSSPMETATYSLLFMGLLYVQGRYLAAPVDSVSRWKPWVVGVGFVFSIWRIDALVLTCGFLLAALFSRQWKPTKADGQLVAICAAMYGAYTLFRFLYFGAILNNPYYAKIQAHLVSPISSAYTNTYLECLAPQVIVIPIVILLAWVMNRRLYGPLLLLVAIQWLFVGVIGGDWMPGFRFWAPLTPCLALLVVGAVKVISIPHISIQLLRALKIVFLLTITAWWTASATTIYQLGGGTPYRFLRELDQFSIVKMNPYWETVQWVKRNVRTDAFLAVQEGGFIPFLTELRAIETYGLCNRELATIQGVTRGNLGVKIQWTENDPATQFILSQKPDLLIIGPSTFWTASATLLSDYRYVASPQTGMFIYVRADSTCLLSNTVGTAIESTNSTTF